MLKAVVFDDEFIVLKGLERLIDWREHGVELAGTAKDGLSALEMFRTLRPDIVMTDIRMPGMDGLQLIERIREEAPDTMCIVFSGYNEFDYVKRAIKLGVVDYLEKPITISKIREGIEKAVARIGERSEMSSLKRRWHEGLLEKATLDLLLYGRDAEEEWRSQFGPEAEDVRGVTVVASADSAFELPEGSGYRVIPVRYGAEYLQAVFHLGTVGSDWTDALQAWDRTAVGSGTTHADAGEAAASYREALRALRYGKYLEGTGWTRYEDLGDGHSPAPELSDLEEGILFDLRLGDKDSLMLKLDDYLASFKQGKVDPEIAELELLKLLLHAASAAKETGGDASELDRAGEPPQLALRRLETRSAQAAWLRAEIERIADWIRGVRMRTKHSAVEKALAYMELHYGRDLTQQEVATRVEMNAAYFSLLFKEQMGLSYIKYLTKLRMEKAKTLLEEGMPTQEISERVGYYHARHFAEVFKKQTGMTPGQYRSTGRGR